MKPHLILSAPSLETITEMIQEYYYSPGLYLESTSDTTWQIKSHNNPNYTNSSTVVLKKNRYRLERN